MKQAGILVGNNCWWWLHNVRKWSNSSKLYSLHKVVVCKHKIDDHVSACVHFIKFMWVYCVMSDLAVNCIKVMIMMIIAWYVAIVIRLKSLTLYLQQLSSQIVVISLCLQFAWGLCTSVSPSKVSIYFPATYSQIVHICYNNMNIQSVYW